jgi:hypothetical protein
MKTEKLSFDAFKQMAECVQSQDVMEQIEGGSWSDCHGFWGQLHKFLIEVVDHVDININVN